MLHVLLIKNEGEIENLKVPFISKFLSLSCIIIIVCFIHFWILKS
jgi:hypothetical protein